VILLRGSGDSGEAFDFFSKAILFDIPLDQDGGLSRGLGGFSMKIWWPGCTQRPIQESILIPRAKEPITEGELGQISKTKEAEVCLHAGPAKWQENAGNCGWVITGQIL
jgi:hypothetical protein